jgi:hypothetical protein|tara:strand:+ start:1960 stop:2589 length:630 start_codon:yes stop_codon:yes gene_type:complete
MKIQENITRLTDLETNDSLSSFMNHVAQQHHNVYQVFYDFMKNIKPKRILEIGTSMGGFTQFLQRSSDDLKLSTKILSLDVNEQKWYDDIIEIGVDLRIENIFIDNFSDIPQEYKDFINKEGTTVILCDGGDKIQEFNLLSNFIKKGDYILAHDYVDTKENFLENYKDKIWNWREIGDEDIKETCKKYNLKSFMKETFDKVVWVCKIKE